MSDLPEHARGDIPELSGLDADIDAAQENVRALEAQRQGLVDARARSVASFMEGYEYTSRSGAKFRITKVKGDYYHDPVLASTPIVWVRYRGVRLFKNGNEGREETLYPPIVEK